MSEIKITKILNKVEDYQETIFAILSFAHLLRWDDTNNKYLPDSYYFIGRKMSTSKLNKHSPNDKVTPDLTVQLNDSYGVLAEAKKSFPNNQDLWINSLQQLEKYDDDLIGWKTPNEIIKTSDIILLTHFMRVVKVSDYVKNKITEGKFEITRNFAIIGFIKAVEAKNFMYFDKGYGNLTDKDLDERLRNRIGIPIEVVEPLYRIKFYDTEPPLPLTMQILWDFIFTQIPKQKSFMASKGRKIIPIRINVHNVTILVREQFGPPSNNDVRQSKFPKTKWIRKALEKFVELKLAEKVKHSREDYIIRFKRIKEPLKFFVESAVEGKVKRIDDFI